MTNYQPRRARDVSELEDNALRCLVNRFHAFPLPVWVITRFGAVGGHGGVKAVRADMECECGVRKVVYRTDNRRMELLSSYYQHPDGVLVEGGRPSGAEASLEARRRQTEAQTTAAQREQERIDREEREQRQREARARRAVREANRVVELRAAG